MKKFKYKEYSKLKMLSIIRKMPILFVETSLNDPYIIRKKDVADFIVLEAERTGHLIELDFYMPGIDEAVVSTYGWFLNTVNSQLRNEIIKRLVLLQTKKIRPKKVKIFNIDKLYKMSKLEMSIENSQIKNYDKFYGKYTKT